jgi:hypothetical protein
VRIFNLSGELEYQFYAFDKNRRGGVLAALGDIDGDGRNEIIAVEAGKTKPLARVLDRNGNVLKDNLSIFDKHYKNGISLAVSDVNCDGKDEIIGGAPQGVGDAVKIIDGNGAIVSSFAPFDSKFYGGINVAAGDLNNDCWAEIVISKRAQGDSVIGIYNYVGKLLSPEFHSYDKHKYGVNISTGDRDKDKSFEILTITDGGRSAEIKILDDDFNLKMSFYPFGKSFVKGLSAYIVTR